MYKSVILELKPKWPICFFIWYPSDPSCSHPLNYIIVPTANNILKRGVYRNDPVCPFVCPYFESATSPEQMNRYWWNFSHLLYLTRGCAWSFHTCYTWPEDVHEVFTLAIPDSRMCMKFSHLLYLTRGCAWSLDRKSVV